jgi:hypothetical protein
MKQSVKIRRYLLGTLSPREQAEWEDKYLADDSAFEELVNGENDLIDSYVRGRLSPGEREQFEKRYCDSLGHIARVKFADTLREAGVSGGGSAADNRLVPMWTKILAFLPAPASLAWAVAATVVIAGGLTWLAIQNHRLRDQLQSARVPQPEFRAPGQEPQPKRAAVPQPANPNIEGTVARGKSRRSESLVAILTLTPGVYRGAGTSQQTLVVGSTKSWVHLQLAMDGNYPRYEAELQTVEGRTITHIPGSEIQARADEELVVMRVPANLLNPGDYILKLSGMGRNGEPDAVEFYSFRAVR